MTQRFSRDTATGWVYRGKIVVLTDEAAQSWAENIVVDLKDAGATIIGSPTAGALSWTEKFAIPGNLTLWMSGGKAMLPDGRSVQRLGLQPDIVARPTIRGLQRGEDEVLARGIQFLRSGH